MATTPQNNLQSGLGASGGNGKDSTAQVSKPAPAVAVPSPNQTSPSPSRPSPVRPAGANRTPQNIADVRAAVGLSAQKPSDMVEGLDKVVDRSERQEQRENAKRKAGGKIDVNTAIHVDDTGARWTRKVWLGLVLAASVVVISLVIMFYAANHKAVSPRQANEVSRTRLELLHSLAERMKKWGVDEDVKLETVTTRLMEKMDEELAALKTQSEASKSDKRPKDDSALREKQELQDLKNLKDGWGQAIEFSLSDRDTLQISLKPATQGEAPAPVSVTIRKKK